MSDINFDWWFWSVDFDGNLNIPILLYLLQEPHSTTKQFSTGITIGCDRILDIFTISVLTKRAVQVTLSYFEQRHSEFVWIIGICVQRECITSYQIPVRYWFTASLFVHFRRILRKFLTKVSNRLLHTVDLYQTD